MSDDRSAIDPAGRYPSEGWRKVEASALRILALLPAASVERTRDAIQIDVGADQGFVLLITPEAIEFRLPTVEWTQGAYGPAEASRLWKRVQAARLSDKRLAALIVEIAAARALEFHACRHCGRSFPPEHRHGDVCHGCAERYEGIVH